MVPGENLPGGATDLLEAGGEEVVPGCDLGEGGPLPEEEGPGVREEDGGEEEGSGRRHLGGIDGVEVEAVHHPDEEEDVDDLDGVHDDVEAAGVVGQLVLDVGEVGEVGHDGHEVHDEGEAAEHLGDKAGEPRVDGDGDLEAGDGADQYGRQDADRLAVAGVIDDGPDEGHEQSARDAGDYRGHGEHAGRAEAVDAVGAAGRPDVGAAGVDGRELDDGDADVRAGLVQRPAAGGVHPPSRGLL